MKTKREERPEEGYRERLPSQSDVVPAKIEEPRLGEIMEVIIAVARNEFDRRAAVGDGSEVLDGIAAGVNMLAEEVGRQVRKERLYRERLVQSERLAAVGQVAAGVAHEVNNPASILLANLTVQRERIGELLAWFTRLRAAFAEGEQGRGELERLFATAEPARALLELQEMNSDNLTGVRRVVDVVKDLRSFARLDKDKIEPVHLHLVVDEACKLVAPQVLYRARLTKQLKEAPTVEADRGKLVQVLTEVLLNAAEAIPEGAPSQNEVVVSTRVEGSYVVASVRDTGRGIPPGLRAHLFDPLFTSNQREPGTGLGLVISAEIVRMHGGELRVESPEGGGTLVEVRFPIEAKRERVSVADAKEAPRPERYKVLIIDDELALLRAYRRLLGADYDLSTAAGARDAQAILLADATWDAIVCDIMMPDLDGEELFAWMQQHVPSVVPRVAFLSGGAFTPKTRAFVEALGTRILAKPLSREQVKQLVEELRPKDT